MNTLTKFFKGMSKDNITQIFHPGHPALDITGNKTNFGYGTPLCAPENVLVLGINGDKPLTVDSHDLEYGYGIRLKGLETGHEYLYWHCLPYFPVWGGDTINRGQIVAFMGDAGDVSQGGSYVPLDQRLSAPYRGTHLHIQMYKDGTLIDPLPFINFSWEPQYTLMDQISATLKVLSKISKQLK